MSDWPKIPKSWLEWRGTLQECGDEGMLQAIGYVRACVAQRKKLNNPQAGFCREYYNACVDGTWLDFARLYRMSISEYKQLSEDAERLSSTVWHKDAEVAAAKVAPFLLGELAVYGYKRQLFCTGRQDVRCYHFGFYEYESLMFMSDDTGRVVGQEPSAPRDALDTIERFARLVRNGSLRLASPLWVARIRDDERRKQLISYDQAMNLGRELWRFRTNLAVTELMGRLLMQRDYGASLMDLLEQDELVSFDHGKTKNLRTQRAV